MPFTKGHKINLGKKYSAERITKSSAWHKDAEKAKEIYKRRALSLIGHKVSEETRRKLSELQIGKEINESQRNGLSIRWGRESNSPLWKGENIGYGALHIWVRNNLGKPRYCANCYDEDKPDRSYHWANVSHQYKRELTDWIRLCASCHSKYDRGQIDILSPVVRNSEI